MNKKIQRDVMDALMIIEDHKNLMLNENSSLDRYDQDLLIKGFLKGVVAGQTSSNKILGVDDF